MIENILQEIFVYQRDPIDFDKNDVKDALLNSSLSDIYQIIKDNRNVLPKIATNNIPQYSKQTDIDTVLTVLRDSSNSKITFEYIGYYLCDKDAKPGAKKKYGENHYKLASQLGLAYSEKCLKITNLGRMYLEADEKEREILREKLTLRIPIVQQLLFFSENGNVSAKDMMLLFLSSSTVERRKYNLRDLVFGLKNCSDNRINQLINNIKW